MTHSNHRFDSAMTRRTLLSSAVLVPSMPKRLLSQSSDKIRDAAMTSWNPTFADFNISANGEAIVFEVENEGTSFGLGVYDWRTEQVRRIPNPFNGYFSDGSFSSDGEFLCAVKVFRVGGMRYSNIVRIDTRSFEWVDVTKPLAGASYVSYPVFRPGSDHILFCEHDDPGPTELKLLESSPERVVSIIDRQNGFSSIFRSSFTSAESVIFPGIYPWGRDLESKIDRSLLGGEQIYKVRFGGKPELALPNIESGIPRPGAGFVSVSCSQNSTKIIALGLSMDQPRRNGGEFNYEVFQLNEAAAPAQLTHVRGYLGFCRVSYDGSVVCFGSKDERNSPTDLNVMDLLTGMIVRTSLRRRLESIAEFHQ
jgi:hypothetical protein